MSVPEEAVSGTIAYLTICFIGIPFIAAYNIISSIFRGMGDSKKSNVFHRCCLWQTSFLTTFSLDYATLVQPARHSVQLSLRLSALSFLL
ncbi:MAG: hypothetical protein ACLRZ6_10620 [Lachnospiraceae bacterium]